MRFVYNPSALDYDHLVHHLIFPIKFSCSLDGSARFLKRSAHLASRLGPRGHIHCQTLWLSGYRLGNSPSSLRGTRVYPSKGRR